MVLVKIFSASRKIFNLFPFQIQNPSSFFCYFPSFFIRFNILNSSHPLSVFQFSWFLLSLFFQIFFCRYRQFISFSSLLVAKLSSKLEFVFECMFLFSQSEILYFILQELSVSQNDASKLSFTDIWSISYRFLLKLGTFRLHTLNWALKNRNNLAEETCKIDSQCSITFELL